MPDNAGVRRLAAGDGAAAYFEYTARHRGSAYLTPFLDALPKACARVLDAGCGGGRLTLMLAEQAQWVIGFDLSDTLLRVAQARQHARSQTNVTWINGDLHEIPFKSASFDFIISANALHLTDFPVAVRQLRRLLKPSGRLVLGDALPSAAHRRFMPIWYPYRTATVFVQLTRMFGARTALRFLQWRLTPRTIRAATRRNRWTAAYLTALFTQEFPGSRIMSHPSFITMAWDKGNDQN